MDVHVAAILEKKGSGVYSIQSAQSVYEAITEMDARNVGSLLVRSGEDIVGIITERDYLQKVILKGRMSKDTPVEAIMTREFVVISAEDTATTALAIMTASRCRHLPVMSEGQLQGIVSIGDVVKAIIEGQEFTIQMLHDYIYRR